MKKFLALVLTIVMLLSVIPLGAITVGAETYNGFTYTISNGEVTITKCDSNIRD